MDLSKQSLNSLRDLAHRLGINSPTSCQKADLLAKIEKRKFEIENNIPALNNSRKGRPNKRNVYIAIKTDDNGKLVFYEAPAPETENYSCDKTLNSADNGCATGEKQKKRELTPQEKLKRKKIRKAKSFLSDIIGTLSDVSEILDTALNETE